MRTLYSGSGSVSFSIGVAFLGEAEWFKLRAATVKLLTVRESREAGESLLWYPFGVHFGGTDFDDDFAVLYAEVASPIYVEIEEIHRAGGRQLFAKIAKTCPVPRSSVRLCQTMGRNALLAAAVRNRERQRGR
jgi:hypothetical protein